MAKTMDYEVVVLFEDGDMYTDYIEAESEEKAYEIAEWNWEDAEYIKIVDEWEPVDINKVQAEMIKQRLGWIRKQAPWILS